MSVLNAIFMAILQAITMCLPTSEAGHIAVFNNFAGRQQNSFSQINGWIEIGIAIGIMLAMYRPYVSLIKECLGTFSQLISDRKKLKTPTRARKFFYMTLIPMLFPALWAIPVGNGNNLYKLLSSLNFDSNIFSEGLFFILTAALLLVLFVVINKNNTAKKDENINIVSALIFGILMLITVPVGGLSYVVVGMLILTLFGVSAKLAFRYTYLMAVPMLFINGIVNINISLNKQSAIAIIIGLIVSIIITFFAIRIARRIFVKNKTDKFSLYNLSFGLIATIIGIVQFFTNKG